MKLAKKLYGNGTYSEVKDGKVVWTIKGKEPILSNTKSKLATFTSDNSSYRSKS